MSMTSPLTYTQAFGHGNLSFHYDAIARGLPPKKLGSIIRRIRRIAWEHNGELLEKRVEIQLFPIDVILTHAVGKSAEFCEPSVIIVSPDGNLLRAISHETLHLVLRRKGIHRLLAKQVSSQRAYEIEQAMVVAIDCVLRKEKCREKYFRGCGVARYMWLVPWMEKNPGQWADSRNLAAIIIDRLEK